MLCSLGRLEALTLLEKENQGRKMANPSLTGRWRQAREAAAYMRQFPGDSYRCGTYALMNAAYARHGLQIDVSEIEAARSPETGFSLNDLQGLATRAQVGFVAVARPGGIVLPVPSVIHWSEGHYAAIVW